MRSIRAGVLIRVAVGGLVLVLGLVAWAGWVVYRSIAPVSGTYTVAGLTHSVEIRYDDFQRPFVTAETMADALFAEGWLHASHRLWQMELFRRAGKGRMSGLLGSALLGTDTELWRTGVPQLAGRLKANASEETRSYIEAYVAGINAAMAARVSSPPEFWLLQHRPEPWSADDVFAMGALMAFQTANNANNELLRLALLQEIDDERAAIFLPDDGDLPGHPYVIPRGDGVMAALERRTHLEPLEQALFPSMALGSNGWAVGPNRSREGAALFAFDSHDSLGLPNLMYEVHLFFEEGKEIRGWSIAGLPGVINGFNECIAWGFTNIGDSQDLFIERRSEEDPLLFHDGDAWYRAEVERVEIPVAGRDEPEVLEIIHTRNGPLISEDPPIALRWATQDLRGMGLDSLLRFNRALNWDEFTAALDAFPAPATNATYADIDGNIGFRTAGLLPIRGHGDGLVPLPGDDPAMRWVGIVEPSELPVRLNPREGFVAAANARVNAAGDGPLVSADNAPGYRVRRLQEVLGSRHDFTVEDMRALQMDWYDGQAALLLPTLLTALPAQSDDPIESSARRALEEWQDDPVAKPDLAAPIIFQAWYRALAYEIFEPELSEALFQRWIRATYPVNHAVDRLILREPDSAWWRGDREGLIHTAFGNALDEIAAEQGDRVSEWRLDRMHRVGLTHELAQAVPQLAPLFNIVPEPWGGSGTTLGRARYRYDQAYDVSGGATVRFVGAMSRTPRMQGVIPGGQSGHPLSRHYRDQFPLWLAGNLLVIPAEPAEVDGNITRLTPR